MKRDLAAFNSCERDPNQSFLYIYSWRPKCVSLGYSQNIDDEIDKEKAGKLGWDIVKRPTGGGIVFHNESEITYSIITPINNPIFPKGLVPSYKKISEAVVIGLKKIGITAQIGNIKKEGNSNKLCFSYPAEYEIIYQDKKIVGSAQKRGKKALLQQGSIFVRNNTDYSILRNCDETIDAVSIEEAIGREIGFSELKDALVYGFKKGLEIENN